jgi:hypothetical protein
MFLIHNELQVTTVLIRYTYTFFFFDLVELYMN